MANDTEALNLLDICEGEVFRTKRVMLRSRADLAKLPGLAAFLEAHPEVEVVEDRYGVSPGAYHAEVERV